jgi:DNA-binding SARP family transcriptional activator
MSAMQEPMERPVPHPDALITVAAPVRIALLGGFRVERTDGLLAESAWQQRRSAKQLIKLIASHPDHVLHREQILEVLWHDVDPASAINSFAKALHAARRALEPEREPRQSSAYLHFKDDVFALDSKSVSIDADVFQKLAKDALRLRTVSAYLSALAAYGGELLPEDRYEDWAAERRTSLSVLHRQLLLGLADEHLQRGELSQAVNAFRAVLKHDPTNEEVHRRLIRLLAETGNRVEAIRQFRICRDVLQSELDVKPGRLTAELYQDVLADRIPHRTEQLTFPPSRNGSVIATTTGEVRPSFIGRGYELQLLRTQLESAASGRGSFIVLSGDTGSGKTRLVSEFAAEARRRRTSVLGHESGTHVSHPLLGPLAVGLEQHLASLPSVERQQLARRHPILTRHLPSLRAAHLGTGSSTASDEGRVYVPGDERLYLLPSLASLLTEISEFQPLMAILGELHDIDPLTLELIQYLAQLASARHWLLVATLDTDSLVGDSEILYAIEGMTRQGLCVRQEIKPLSTEDCHQLIASLLPGAPVDDRILEHVTTLSLGYPLYAEELVREMMEKHEIVQIDGRWRAATPSGAAPQRVRNTVRRYMAHLDADTSLVITLAAAAGSPATLSFILGGAAMVTPSVSGGAVLGAVDRALQSHLVEARDHTIVFRHPLIRTAWLEELSTVRRAQVLGVLGQLGADSSSSLRGIADNDRDVTEKPALP